MCNVTAKLLYYEFVCVCVCVRARTRVYIRIYHVYHAKPAHIILYRYIYTHNACVQIGRAAQLAYTFMYCIYLFIYFISYHEMNPSQ